jgi:anti-sigma factor RsiW
MSSQIQDAEHEEPADEQLVELVGYLDGELDGTQMDLIERELINDPDLRSHADILSRTWALLDVLEEAPASRQFTQDTMATVSSTMVAERDFSWRHRLRSLLASCARYKVLTFFAAGVAGALIGLFLANRTPFQKSRAADAADALVLEKLDMLINDPLYREVPDAESLRRLQISVRSTPELGDKPQ